MEKKSSQTAASTPTPKQERRRTRKDAKGSQFAGKRGGDRDRCYSSRYECFTYGNAILTLTMLLCALTVARLVIRTQMLRQASTPMPTSCLPLKAHRYTSVSARKICARPWRFWGDARQPWAKYCGLRLVILLERATVFQSAVCACCGSVNCNAGAFCRLHTPPIFNGRDAPFSSPYFYIWNENAQTASGCE